MNIEILALCLLIPLCYVVVYLAGRMSLIEKCIKAADDFTSDLEYAGKTADEKLKAIGYELFVPDVPNGRVINVPNWQYRNEEEDIVVNIYFDGAYWFVEPRVLSDRVMHTSLKYEELQLFLEKIEELKAEDEK